MKEEVRLLTGVSASTDGEARAGEEPTTEETLKKARCPRSSSNFLMAIEEYKQYNSRPFPTWTEVLEIIKAIGYRKVAEPQSLEQLAKQKAENYTQDESIPETADQEY